MSGKKDDAKSDKKNWYSDRYQFVVIQRNILALITLLSLICSIMATFSISQLAPLKAVDPFVIQVDQKTGVTQVVDPLKARELTTKESVNQYFIVQYIRARESFVDSPQRNAFNRDVVRVLSDGNVYHVYQKDMNTSDPDSIPSRLGVGGGRRVEINSIKFLDKQDLLYGEESRRYLVKAKITENVPGRLEKTTNELILIEFKYAELALTIEERYLNPLGFQVLSYRTDEDTLTQ